MNLNQIKEGLQSIAPNGYRIKRYSGGFMLQKKAKDLTYNIGINYLDYAPKYKFTAITWGIHFHEVHQILNSFQQKNQDQFNSTIIGSSAFSEQFLRQGIVSAEEFKVFLEEVDNKIHQEVFKWFSEHEDLKKVVQALKNLAPRKRNAYLGKVHADMKMLILFWITGEQAAYQTFKTKTLSNYEAAIKRAPQLQQHLRRIQALLIQLETDET